MKTSRILTFAFLFAIFVVFLIIGGFIEVTEVAVRYIAVAGVIVGIVALILIKGGDIFSRTILPTDAKKLAKKYWLESYELNTIPSGLIETTFPSEDAELTAVFSLTTNGNHKISVIPGDKVLTVFDNHGKLKRSVIKPSLSLSQNPFEHWGRRTPIPKPRMEPAEKIIERPARETETIVRSSEEEEL